MITTDIYGSTLSGSFESAIVSSSQYIKPLVIVEWLDSRHCKNKTYSTTSPHPSAAQGDLGYYFSKDQIGNGIRRQSYTWGVTDSLDKTGKVIRADGTWFAMPNDKKALYEYGWWSNSLSSSTPGTGLNPPAPGFIFSSNPVVSMTFTPRACNLIRIFTSEYYGQIDTYLMTVRSSDSGVANPLYQAIGRIKDGEYYFEHAIPASLGHSTVNEVEIEIITTKNPNDHARIECVDVLLEEDMSDYVVSYSYSKTRDLHETSLPIGGSDSGSLGIEFDNTEKGFNVFSNASEYGRYLTKDLRIRATSGWKVYDSEDQYIEGELRNSMSLADSTVSLVDNSSFPEGGEGDHFVVEIDYDTVNRELVLCSGKSNDYVLNISQRGFAKTLAKNHSAGALVRLDTFQYPAFTEFFSDEWNTSTSDMVVSLSCFDWSKYMSERMLTEGFFVEKSSVAEACEALILKTNFPKGDIDSLHRFDIAARRESAILHLDFNESSVDRAGNQIVVSDGLRSRFFSIPDGFPSKVRDVTADDLDRELTQLEKALGELSFIPPDLVAVSSNISSNTSLALDLIDFSFTDKSGSTVSENYNMVFDGFYVPNASGNQSLYVYIAEGGVRLYIDDTIVLDRWRLHDSTFPTYTVVQSSTLNLVAGRPYKVKIEAFHQYGSFSIKLAAAVGIQAPAFLPKGAFKTVSGLDKIGSRNPPFAPGALERNKNGNYNIYLGNPTVGIKEGLPSNLQNYVVNFGGGKYSRLPYHSSWDVNNPSSNNYNKNNWSIELFAKTPEVYSGNGEYLSNWSNSSPSGGFEFFSNSSSHGFKLVAGAGGGVITLSSSEPLQTDRYNHIFISCNKGNQIEYYLNGNLLHTQSIPTAFGIASWVNRDLTFGGRGATYTTSEVAPAVTRNLFMDEFVLYNKHFTLEEVKKRYTETQMQELTIYPFLYGSEESVRSILDSITLADFGRFYINELNIATYEHMNMFFETSIDRHASVQLVMDDDTSIISADQLVQLQTNKVVVKVSGIASNLTGLQSLWRADSPTTLAVVQLEANIGANDEGMFVSTTRDPPFPKAGYLIIDDEIVKYSNVSPNQFLSLERGYFGTTKASHVANTKVREVRSWDLKYSKSPAFQVRKPFITGIEFEEPDEIVILRFSSTAYGAELIIAASNNTPVGGIVFAEGTDPLTERVSFTAISGIPVLVTEQSSQIEEQSSEIEDSVAINGVKELVIENQFISDFDHAKKLADFIISKNASAVPILEASTVPLPKIQIGDRIKISELDAFDIINGEYWVVSKSYNYGSSVTQSFVLRKTV